MYYFIYCTYLLDSELRKYLPETKRITTAKAKNHEFQLRAVAGRPDRGWCHLADRGDVLGRDALGIVVECNDDRVHDDFDDFDVVYLTVQGDDGRYYDCFTYVLSNPGIPMRPPRYYWERIPNGLREQNFPQEYRDKVQAIFDAAAECPDFDRPVPADGPGRAASTR